MGEMYEDQNAVPFVLQLEFCFLLYWDPCVRDVLLYREPFMRGYVLLNSFRICSNQSELVLITVNLAWLVNLLDSSWLLIQKFCWYTSHCHCEEITRLGTGRGTVLRGRWKWAPKGGLIPTKMNLFLATLKNRPTPNWKVNGKMEWPCKVISTA